MLTPDTAADPEPGPITGVVAASPGWRVNAYAPRGTDISAVPTPSHVVAWALIPNLLEPGGSTVQPVFVAGARTWTPDQFRAAYGESLELKVAPA
ncbi:hypothetical protein ACGFZS_47355 [Streptomyces sp. NPDC048288]|uniref:hypothetical protein n=1 Tax=Streptomyces sp. NPDC048288 TaxID=3365529 RepID=UPI00371D728B